MSVASYVIEYNVVHVKKMSVSVVTEGEKMMTN